MDRQLKVAIINGQNHKGSTYHVGRIVAEKITNVQNITEFFLPRDFGEFCCGCVNCIGKSETLCPHADKLKVITDAMDDVDIIILTSPVYVYHCTGSMKAFLDHYGYRWIIHRAEEKMFSKQGVVISTCAGSGSRSTNKDMKDSLSFWGVPIVHSIGVAVMECTWDKVSLKIKDKIEKKTDKVSLKIKKTPIKARGSLKARFFFLLYGILQKKGWNSADVEYWKEKGWTEKSRPWKK